MLFIAVYMVLQLTLLGLYFYLLHRNKRDGNVIVIIAIVFSSIVVTMSLRATGLI